MIIKNGLVVDPALGLSEKMDLAIENGTILKIEKNIDTDQVSNDTEVLDATGLVVAPGLIDTHVHFRDPGFTYKEDLHTGALAAAKGGFTSVICMANTSPVVDSLPVLKDLIDREKNEDIRIFQAAAISCSLKGKEAVDMEAMKNAGACGFTDDGIPLLDADFCYRAMEHAAKLDVPVSLHEEDPSFIQNNGINHGAISEKLGVYGSPSIAEESLVARDCLLALRSGADVVIQHISSGVSVEMVRTFKALGAKIHAEATPHHFTLTDEALLTYGTLAKMNPPLRTKEDVEALQKGLADDIMDVIATDHAPHAASEKEQGIQKAPFGIVGLETAAALTYTALVKPGILTPMQMAEKMSYNPAKILGLDKGTVEAGSPADLTIFDPECEWVIDPAEFLSKGKNTPFGGKKVTGKVMATIVDGEIVYQEK